MEAERAGLPKTRMLERLAEEALGMRRFPGIVFRGPEHRRRASVVGTGMDVWEVLMLHEAEGREALLGAHPVTERQLDTALAYYREYPEEVDRFLEENGRSPEYWQKREGGGQDTRHLHRRGLHGARHRTCSREGTSRVHDRRLPGRAKTFRAPDRGHRTATRRHVARAVDGSHTVARATLAAAGKT